MLLVCFALGVEIVADHADDRIHRIRAPEGEENMIEVAGRQVCQFCCQFDRRLARIVEIARRIGQATHLFRGGLYDTFVAIAGIDAPESRKAVEQFVALGIRKKYALSRLHDRCTTRLMGPQGQDGMKVMGTVLLNQ